MLIFPSPDHRVDLAFLRYIDPSPKYATSIARGCGLTTSHLEYYPAWDFAASRRAPEVMRDVSAHLEKLDGWRCANAGERWSRWEFQSPNGSEPDLSLSIGEERDGRALLEVRSDQKLASRTLHFRSIMTLFEMLKIRRIGPP
ncbi:MAG: hypothetical protein ACHQ50_00860 [Fimbriimonadales bacterium]